MPKQISKNAILIIALSAPLIIGYIIYKYKNRNKQNKRSKKDIALFAPEKKRIDIKEKSTLTQALEYKIDGNEKFKKGDYQAAIDNYTKAINICSSEKKEDLATFYNNRAAAFFHLQKYQETVDDCTNALNLKNKAYPKALYRRGISYECMNKLEESFADLTSACFLEQFGNSETLQVADRVLKTLSQAKAKEYLKDKRPRMPATKFIQSYISSFHHDPFFNMDALEDHSKPETSLDIQPDITNNGLDSTLQDHSHSNGLISVEGEIDSETSFQTVPNSSSDYHEINDHTLNYSKLHSSSSFDMSDFDDIVTFLRTEKYESIIPTCETLLKKYNLILNSQIDIDEKANPSSDVNMNQDNTKVTLQKVNRGETLEKKHLILLLRATMNLLQGSMTDAKQDLEAILKVIEPKEIESVQAVIDGLGTHLCVSEERFKANVYIKYASYLTQETNVEDAGKYFDKAIATDPENCDPYYHKAQFCTLFGEFDKALAAFDRSLLHCPTDFPLAKIQRDYTAFKVKLCPDGSGAANSLAGVGGDSAALSGHPFPGAMLNPAAIETASRTLTDGLEATVKRYPRCSEGHVFLAQAYTDIMNCDKAEKEFEEALLIDPQNFTVYVHLALLVLQSSGDVDRAITLVKKALEIEPKCEFAYETLGTIEMQRNNSSEALKNFEKAMELVKTEFEVGHLLAMIETVKAQQKAVESLGSNVLPALFGR